MVYICLVRPMNRTVGNIAVGNLHYMHWAVHGSETIVIKTAESKLLLDALEHEFLELFMESTYPIVTGHDPFRIILIDESV